MVIVNQYAISMNAQYWSAPKQFNPDRFLASNGNFLTVKSKVFIPFSTGRRICLGEQMAINDLFIILVRFIQLTQDYRIDLAKKQTSLEPNINTIQAIDCQAFDIIINKN